jgi:hypothetical protein
MVDMKKVFDIPIPCEAEVEKYLEQWKQHREYELGDRILEKIFSENKGNKDVATVKIKVIVLNALYTTQIYAVSRVAEHICNQQNLDDLLVEGKTEAIDTIKKVPFGNGKPRTLYSFATKYCHFHNPSAYPIYDNNVDSALWYFKDELKDEQSQKSFQRKVLKGEYSKFKSIIDRFKERFGLMKYTYKEIDQYLWMLGKRYL